MYLTNCLAYKETDPVEIHPMFPELEYNTIANVGTKYHKENFYDKIDRLANTCTSTEKENKMYEKTHANINTSLNVEPADMRTELERKAEYFTQQLNGSF